MTSQRSSGIDGQRFANHLVEYGSGASSPPTQNGHSALGRLGRFWRDPTTWTSAPADGSNRGFDGVGPELCVIVRFSRYRAQRCPIPRPIRRLLTSATTDSPSSLT